jgi:hypothetical protein
MHGKEKTVQPEDGTGANRRTEASVHQRGTKHQRYGQRAIPGISQEGKNEKITRMERARKLFAQQPSPNPASHKGGSMADITIAKSQRQCITSIQLQDISEKLACVSELAQLIEGADPKTLDSISMAITIFLEAIRGRLDLIIECSERVKDEPEMEGA